MTLPVSATTEQAFTAINIMKTRLQNKMKDKFLTNYLIIYTEKENIEKFSADSNIDYFHCTK